MPGFHTGGNVRTPSLWFGQEDTPGEPVLFLLRRDGARAVMTLDLFRTTAEDIFRSELDMEDAWENLYVILPGRNELTPCTIGFAGTAEKPLLLLTGDAPGVLWTCDL